MFGKLRRNKIQAPIQGATLTAATKSSVDPSMLILVHSRGQGSTPAHKALMSRAMANPPTRTNAVLAKGLAGRGLAGLAHAAAPLANASNPTTNPATVAAEPAKGDMAWDVTGPR
jgi:hypothetical protein